MDMDEEVDKFFEFLGESNHRVPRYTFNKVWLYWSKEEIQAALYDYLDSKNNQS